VPKVSTITTPATPRAAPKRASAMPAASASLSTTTSLPAGAALVNVASTSVPIHDSSTFAAERATPCWMTAGKVAPTRPVHPAARSISATTAATASGVAGWGVGSRVRGVRSAPVTVSTSAPLMPLPPMSIPKARDREAPRGAAPEPAWSVTAETLAVHRLHPTSRRVVRWDRDDDRHDGR
jgi:hypothetical protein